MKFKTIQEEIAYAKGVKEGLKQGKKIIDETTKKVFR